MPSVAHVREGYTRTWSPMVARFLTVASLSELHQTVGLVSRGGTRQTWGFYISHALLFRSPASVVGFYEAE